MIRTIASALAAFALLSFGARAEDAAKPADTTAPAATKADKAEKKAHKKAHKKAKKADAAKSDTTAPAK